MPISGCASCGGDVATEYATMIADVARRSSADAINVDLQSVGQAAARKIDIAELETIGTLVDSYA